LLRLMREQAQMYGASIETGRVTRLDRIEGGFQAEWGAGCVTARKVLLATGVTNRRPPMDEDVHDERCPAASSAIAPSATAMKSPTRKSA
jgi:thioredoxin reductase (NADPH)